MGKYLEIAQKGFDRMSQDCCTNEEQSLTTHSVEAAKFSHCELRELSELSPDEIPIAAELVEIVQMRERGETPPHYTATTTCKHCGPVPIWEGCPPEVLGCPWCFNRHAANR